MTEKEKKFQQKTATSSHFGISSTRTMYPINMFFFLSFPEKILFPMVLKHNKVCPQSYHKNKKTQANKTENDSLCRPTKEISRAAISNL